MAASSVKAANFELVNTQPKSKEEAQPIARKSRKERLKRILREIFEGHEEYLGITPD